MRMKTKLYLIPRVSKQKNMKKIKKKKKKKKMNTKKNHL